MTRAGALGAALLCMAGVGARPAASSVRRVAEMNAEEIRALDRASTVVILPGGILEQHGPYLPSYSDGYFNERLSDELAAAIAERPGWTALVFPTIPLGNGPANEIGGLYSFAGSYPVRSETLRAIFLDLATELGEQGFRWVFVVHGHGAPNHNRALDQAGDYFRDTYRGRMVNLVGLQPVFDSWGAEQTPEEASEDGLQIHAGMSETSLLLFLRPDLVAPGHSAAAPLGDRTMGALVSIAKRPGWPGYFGSPRLATAQKGARDFEKLRRVAVGLALEILEGRDVRSIPRYGDTIASSPSDVEIDREALKHEAGTRNRQEKWLKSRTRR